MGDSCITKNYWDIIIIAIDGNVYNTQSLNRIQTEIERILRKNQNSFRENRSTNFNDYDFVHRWSIWKNIEATFLFADFSKALDSIRREKMVKMLQAYDL